jgi:hypothetical protein
MLVSASWGNASEISLAAAQQLFNASAAFSLLNTEYTTTWYNASYGAAGNTAKQQIQSAFDLSDSQIAQLLDWYQGSFRSVLVEPYLVGVYANNGVNSTNDLAWLQWGQCAIATHGVQKTYFDAPQSTTPTNVEYGCVCLANPNPPIYLAPPPLTCVTRRVV